MYDIFFQHIMNLFHCHCLPLCVSALWNLLPIFKHGNQGWRARCVYALVCVKGCGGMWPPVWLSYPLFRLWLWEMPFLEWIKTLESHFMARFSRGTCAAAHECFFMILTDVFPWRHFPASVHTSNRLGNCSIETVCYSVLFLVLGSHPVHSTNHKADANYSSGLF